MIAFWSKKARVFFYLGLFLFSKGLFGNDSGCFSLQGELLYLKPGVDQSYYVISSIDNVVEENIFPNGRRHNLDPKYRPAFRIEALAPFCNTCNNLDLRFTYFNGGNSNTTDGDFLFDTIGYPGNGAQDPEDTFYTGIAKFHENFRYYGGDVTINRLVLNGCRDGLALIFGLHYAHIRVNDDFSSSGTRLDDIVVIPVSNSLHRNSQFWGVGPEFGIDYHFMFYPCLFQRPQTFSFVANARASLLASHTNAHFHYSTLRTGGIGVNLSNKPLWRVTPSVDARLGLSYNFCCPCFSLYFEAGYEFIWYSKCVDSITGYDVAFAGDSIDVFSDLSLQGPYIAICMDF